MRTFSTISFECCQRPIAALGLFLLLASSAFVRFATAQEPPRFPLHLKPGDVLPTGNEWIALPDIRAVDGALGTFNVLSMRHRGLLQVEGNRGGPVLEPYFAVNGQPLSLHNPEWQVIEYWIPTAHQSIDGLDLTLTWCAPPGSRAAFLRLTAANRRSESLTVTLGVRAAFGSLQRVTYVPVDLRGERTVATAPWVSPAEVFSYSTADTDFAWTLMHPGSTAYVSAPPLAPTPAVDSARTVTLAPGQTAESLFLLAAGTEEFSAAHAARALNELLQRYGAAGMIARSAAWLKARTRTTTQPDLDLLMNRNFLFTELYAWGRTLDTEQLVGVTSRSPRYYVSAAYWDRDAMLWSFPGLLDSDPAFAAEALDYALTTQLRNTGTHSRFIDGVVLEDGFQLDEAVAPLVALAAYVEATSDTAFLAAHRNALELLRQRLLSRYDAGTGLYSSVQDSQDEFQLLPFITYDNTLVWRALKGISALYTRLNEPKLATEIESRADALRAAILSRATSNSAPGVAGPIFASATDGKQFVFTEIPPGSLMKLPSLGFISENDPIFVNTYNWLHSEHYQYSYSKEPYGLPGSYRLPFTTSWSIADHLTLALGRDQALKILRASNWDGGIITEGVSATTGEMDQAGRAFATAAGYMAHAICNAFCTGKPR
jgi:hypothetical protein